MQRFGGLSEEELGQKVLPDYLKADLNILLVGVNPSYTSVHVGHHYAGAGNHLWPCLFESGLVPHQMTCYEDSHLLAFGIGLTNLCSRPTRGATELTKNELKDGASNLLQKVQTYRPKIIAFNGKGIYESFSGNKNFYMGKQPNLMSETNTIVFVMPSSSARCSKLPRPHDKMPFFHALRKLRDFACGLTASPADEEVIFTDYTLLRSLEPPMMESSRKKKARQGIRDRMEAAPMNRPMMMMMTHSMLSYAHHPMYTPTMMRGGLQSSYYGPSLAASHHSPSLSWSTPGTSATPYFAQPIPPQMRYPPQYSNGLQEYCSTPTSWGRCGELYSSLACGGAADPHPAGYPMMLCSSNQAIPCRQDEYKKIVNISTPPEWTVDDVGDRRHHLTQGESDLCSPPLPSNATSMQGQFHALSHHPAMDYRPNGDSAGMRMSNMPSPPWRMPLSTCVQRMPIIIPTTYGSSGSSADFVDWSATSSGPSPSSAVGNYPMPHQWSGPHHFASYSQNQEDF